ncbi:glycan metabolism protein [Elizabethkingia meningoseptica]|uniref:RagB/SusD family nutrient uptake outer membrane protein n=1 Tax=Elizabethkingia meningoseptica TaxID=238 RepID=UPI000332D55A|nr:RagB/SusD family nutrient uptake outer membrane protein [Elizabethkingia meningoseptica]AQX04574.1 glycan metabolism protein [Elizabethkingia meningoseptica]AQX46618.1 glycan metabolism protein [Elizabethkingia meningoseptica]EOR31417.1 RagB/SusD domain-containing protein [Elizabethkingia meningoseptica ATCC 13253 = NBRC 12535]KUY19132.1 glycan metabolism protein [Elizabethkingia meningoseptica]MDE5431597.1 RagB/SusD family nutrient uptake outer membrane protein [Elizabethkingia meningosept
MKNNILKVALATASIFYMQSCSNVLDTEPITDQIVVPKDVLPDAATAENRMKSLYSQFGEEYWQLDYFMNGDSQTDVSYAGGDNVQNFQQDEYRILSTNTNVNRDWNYLYTYIYRANIILNNVDKVPDLSSARKSEMKAEASLLRAMALFHAVQLWGDVPIVTQAIVAVNSENFNEIYSQAFPDRKPVTEVYDAIIKDVESSIATLPASSNKYRANKGAAYALLAKVYATKPGPDWTKVLDYTTRVEGEGYSLVANYDDLFDGNHEGNIESIFEANGEGWGSTIGAWGTSMFYGTDWKKFNTPANALVKAYDDEKDTVRKKSTVWFSDKTVSWSDTYWPSSNFPFAYKMRKTDGTQNFYIFRLSDILLLKAEAQAQTGDLAGAAVNVNKIRTRAALSPVAFATKADAIDKILKERYLELAFEGHRWFDLKRTGKSVEMLSQQKDGTGKILPYAGNLTAGRLLWPIPQVQRDKNPNLTQNPGY